MAADSRAICQEIRVPGTGGRVPVSGTRNPALPSDCLHPVFGVALTGDDIRGHDGLEVLIVSTADFDRAFAGPPGNPEPVVSLGEHSDRTCNRCYCCRRSRRQCDEHERRRAMAT